MVDGHSLGDLLFGSFTFSSPAALGLSREIELLYIYIYIYIYIMYKVISYVGICSDVQGG
jgi:hypothetical protein